MRTTFEQVDRGIRPSGDLSTILDEALCAAVAEDSSAPLCVLRSAEPTGWRDVLTTLLAVHDLSLAPLDRLAGRERWEHDPMVVELRVRLEKEVVGWLEVQRTASDPVPDVPGDPVATMRRLARAGAVPPIYEWVAGPAPWSEVRAFLALEGGPDARFDDLVALAQVGLRGAPKLELARNYWDEMGRGDAGAVHTELHRAMAESLQLQVWTRDELPVEALEREVLGGLLALSRRFQPEAIGAFGLLELEAGPRCRRVLTALEHHGAEPAARAFYAEHAEADPRHGKDWLDHAVAELGRDPRWAEGIVRGARWRSLVNRRFFRRCEVLFGLRDDVSALSGERPVGPAIN